MRGLGLFAGWHRRAPLTESGAAWEADFTNPDFSGMLAALMIGA